MARQEQLKDSTKDYLLQRHQTQQQLRQAKPLSPPLLH
jgi:hypothetical protein